MQRTIFANGSVFDGSKPVPGRTDVAIEGSRIAAIGRKITPRGGDRVIDLEGRTLMPGLISCHMHADSDRHDYKAFIQGERYGTELPQGVLMALCMRTCGALLDTGFTGYIGAAAPFSLDAQLKIAIAEGIMTGPRILACSAHIATTADNNDSAKWWVDVSPSGTEQYADGPDALRRLVRDQIRKGAQVIKVFASGLHGTSIARGVRNMASDELAMIVRTAHERGALVRAHVCPKDIILECIELGVDIIDHADEIDEDCIERMATKGTYWVPSLLFLVSAIEGGFPDPGGLIAKAHTNVKAMIPKAQTAGVRILPGDDYGAFFMPHRAGIYAKELTAYVHAGMDPAIVLSWGTRNAGHLLSGEHGRVGVIETGALADIVVLNGNPLRDISILEYPERSVAAVMKDGIFVRDALPHHASAGLRAVSNPPLG
jgi:imidazolonepropionase-like amidohydrolase